MKINEYEYEHSVKMAISKAAAEFQNSIEHRDFENEKENLTRIRDVPELLGKTTNYSFQASVAITERALYHLLIDLGLVEFE